MSGNAEPKQHEQRHDADPRDGNQNGVALMPFGHPYRSDSQSSPSTTSKP